MKITDCIIGEQFLVGDKKQKALCVLTNINQTGCQLHGDPMTEYRVVVLEPGYGMKKGNIYVLGSSTIISKPDKDQK